MRIHALALLTLLLVSQQQAATIAVQVSPDRPVEVISVSEAQAQFKKLCADGSDDRRLRALAAALNPMPDWPQFVMNGETSVCNRNPKPVVPVPMEKQK